MELTTDQYRPTFNLLVFLAYGSSIFVMGAFGYALRSFRQLLFAQTVAMLFVTATTLCVYLIVIFYLLYIIISGKITQTPLNALYIYCKSIHIF